MTKFLDNNIDSFIDTNHIFTKEETLNYSDVITDNTNNNNINNYSNLEYIKVKTT